MYRANHADVREAISKIPMPEGGWRELLAIVLKGEHDVPWSVRDQIDMETLWNVFTEMFNEDACTVQAEIYSNTEEWSEALRNQFPWG